MLFTVRFRDFCAANEGGGDCVWIKWSVPSCGISKRNVNTPFFVPGSRSREKSTCIDVSIFHLSYKSPDLVFHVLYHESSDA